jgi:anti-sigma factor RsiW
MTEATEIKCDVCASYTSAYLDNELDAPTVCLVNAHLEQCQSCILQYKRASSLLQGLRQNARRFGMPEGLAELIKEHCEPQDNELDHARAKKGSDRRWLEWFIPSLSSAVAAMALTLFLTAPLASDRLADEVVSSHVRSLMEHHLVDVESSDKHTVKPWFTGKLDFSPPVVDLAASGFPLIGGRLDYLEHQSVAALSYGHGKHTINVFIMPETKQNRPLAVQTIRGFNVVSWSSDHMLFYIVSDANAGELKLLAQLLR